MTGILVIFIVVKGVLGILFGGINLNFFLFFNELALGSLNRPISLFIL